MLEKPKLFLNLKEFWLSILFLALLLLVRLFFLHQAYAEFKSKPFFYTDVEVVQAYEKWNANEYHTILKVYAPKLDMNFFTRIKIHAKDIHSHLRLKLFPHEELSFVEYLGTSFIFSNVNQIYDEKQSAKSSFLDFVEKQHENKEIKAFYTAIYFAAPLEKSLRKQVSTLGVSHLIALSGYHLAILSGLLFFLLRPTYRFFQKRHFPYRFDLHDIGFVVLVLLAFYVWFVGAPPSLLRSFTMLAMTWVLLVLGMELLSFYFLAIVVLLLLVVFPKMLLSLAFWFSVVGVFYIFLLLKHFSTVNNYLMTLFISFGIFVLMLPVVHLIFPVVDNLQLASPFISLVFTFFYPLSMLLHLIGLGNLFDPLLMKLFTLEANEHLFILDYRYGLAYLSLSLLAIYSKKIFYVLSFGATTFTVWLFTGFWVY